MRAFSTALAAALVATSCGSGGGTTTAAPPDQVSSAEAPSNGVPSDGTPMITDRSGQPVPTTAPPPPSDVAAARFEIDGAVVWTGTTLDQLPERATVVRFTSTLLDAGDGLELCISGVATSLPPQCAGPVVDGLSPDGWTETADGVTWGVRTVTVSWPPVDGHLTLVSDEEPVAAAPLGDERPDGLPDACQSIGTFTPRDVIAAFAADHPDRVAGARSVNDGSVAVLAVVEEHLEEVRAELTTGEAEPCLEPARYSASELEAAQSSLGRLYGPEGPVLSSGGGIALNRVDVTVPVADRATVALVVAGVDDPGVFHVIGVGEILEGSG